MRKLTQSGLALWIVVLALLGNYAITMGHAEYDHSDPPAAAVLTTAPTTVRVWFTQELFRRDGMNALAVYGADGSRVDMGEPTIDDDDRKLLTVALAVPLPDGEYTVQWQATSAEDGHTAEGEFAFTVNSTNAVASENVTATGPTTATLAEPTATTAAAPATVAPAVTPTSGTPTGGLPGNCAFGAAPIMLFAVTLWGRRQRRATVARRQSM